MFAPCKHGPPQFLGILLFVPCPALGFLFPLPIKLFCPLLLLVFLLGEPTATEAEPGSLEPQVFDALAHPLGVAFQPPHVFLKPGAVVDNRVTDNPAGTVIEFAALHRLSLGQLTP